VFEAWDGTPVARWNRPMLEVYLAQHPDWSLRLVAMRVNALRSCARSYQRLAGRRSTRCTGSVIMRVFVEEGGTGSGTAWPVQWKQQAPGSARSGGLWLTGTGAL
jgi:hypothetical protein